jgi:hypothetical protein
VQICPIPEIKAPSRAPKNNAAKNPGAESKATVWIGLGGCMKDPITDNAEKTASLAIRNVLEV